MVIITLHFVNSVILWLNVVSQCQGKAPLLIHVYGGRRSVHGIWLNCHAVLKWFCSIFISDRMWLFSMGCPTLTGQFLGFLCNPILKNPGNARSSCGSPSSSKASNMLNSNMQMEMTMSGPAGVNMQPQWTNKKVPFKCTVGGPQSQS